MIDDPPTGMSSDDHPSGGKAVGDRCRRERLWVIVAAARLTVMAGAVLGPIVPRMQSASAA